MGDARPRIKPIHDLMTGIGPIADRQVSEAELRTSHVVERDRPRLCFFLTNDELYGNADKRARFKAMLAVEDVPRALPGIGKPRGSFTSVTGDPYNEAS